MPSKSKAIKAVAELLETEYPGEGLGIESLLYFDDDGDGTYAFALLSGDPASYVHADGTVRWQGSRLGTPEELAEVAFENTQAERPNANVTGSPALSASPSGLPGVPPYCQHRLFKGPEHG